MEFQEIRVPLVLRAQLVRLELLVPQETKEELALQDPRDLRVVWAIREIPVRRVMMASRDQLEDLD